MFGYRKISEFKSHCQQKIKKTQKTDIKEVSKRNFKNLLKTVYNLVKLLYNIKCKWFESM